MTDLYCQNLYPRWSKFHDLEYSKSEQDPVGQKMERTLVSVQMVITNG